MISDKRIAIKYLIFILACVFVSAGDAKVRCIEREREALLSFKNGLINDDGFLSTWESDECCKWYGVECSNTTDHVIALQLNTTYYDGVLQGEVGSSLLELHHLNYLDLSWNDFGGNPIPKFIGSMKQLQHLFLGGCNFGGIVPPRIGNLTNLQSLALSHNSLRIENLDWLSSLSLLFYLSLSQIDLSQTNWLQHILSLHSLHELHLDSCNIGGTTLVGSSVNSSSTSLSIISLSDNQLTFSSLHWLSNISRTLVKLDISTNALGSPKSDALIERLVLIEYLDLSNNTLEGQIPKSLFNLSRLHTLVLYENDLRGNIDELFGNTSGKGILESLQILDLAHNKFNGSLPDLRAFSALTEVYFGGNNFTGFIPLSIGQLSELRVLDLSNNLLEGVVSESHLIKLNKLKELDLSFNSLILHFASDWSPAFQLDGILLAGCNVGLSFPKWIQTQRNVYTLDLSRANIVGEIPAWLWNVSPSLTNLYLSDNQITGIVPNLSSTSITVLDLSNNSISGPIPSFYANSRDIKMSVNMLFGSISSICSVLYESFWFLDLSNNQLAGEIPNCWQNFPYLISLNLENNRLWGEIPSSLGSLQHLVVLQLRGNSLSGEFPSTLRSCHDLQLVDVSQNELTGDIPTWFGETNRMVYLKLGRNKLHGSIPVEICNLTRIHVLDFSRNNLSGKIQDCFHNFTLMAQKYEPASSHRLSYTQSFTYNPNLPNVIKKKYIGYLLITWKGQELEFRNNLKFLKLIDLSSNRLSGNIPKSFSSMKGLVSLNLSLNSFTGNIIPDIGEMEMLECLDLSKNQLFGKIPSSLAHLKYLDFLDLSNNNLSGEIPTSTQLQSFNASAYAGNDGLCGPSLALCPKDILKPPTTLPKKDISLSFMQEVGISMGFGFIFGFWGVIGTFILKKTWRIAFFNLFDAIGDWFYVRIAIFASKLRRS